MLCCAASFVIAAYFYVHLISQDLRALPAAFLRNHLNSDFLHIHQLWQEKIHTENF
jgi:hypothetical protein